MKIKLKLPKILMLLGLAGIMTMIYSCYPNNELTTSELDIVATDYDDNYFNNKSPKTYHLPDTVGVIGDGESQLSPAMQAFILEQINRNMANLGWDKKDDIDENDLPDVIMTTSALVVTTTGAGCIPWYPWWGWYPWYPGWGWGGGYCYPAYVYSYQTGTLVIDMIDPNEGGNEEFGLVWHAGINGLTRSSQSGNQEFVRKTIDQAFSQSPYLKR